MDLNGTPELSGVPTELVPGKCILITGHDLTDLRTLLEMCESRDINVYTHGEMLPAFMYPELRRYKCLKANFGQAWHAQQREFRHFPGPIIFTSNCIMKPLDSYIDKCFTTGPVGYEGVRYVKNDQWDEVIKAAEAMGGFRDK